MGKWIEVVKVEEFTGKVRVVEYEGEQIAVFKLAEGFYAIDDECSHAEASLAEGEIVDECRIECPLHGALFDIKTGRHLTPPAVIPVRSYPTTVTDGIVMIEVDE